MARPEDIQKLADKHRSSMQAAATFEEWKEQYIAEHSAHRKLEDAFDEVKNPQGGQ